MNVEKFSKIYNGPFKRFLLLSKHIGNDVLTHSSIADQAFLAELRYLEFSENFRKPTTDSFILNPIIEHISKICKYVAVDPSMVDHINVLNQSIKALLWIQQKEPVAYLEEIISNTKTYIDNLLTFFKDKENHAEWVEAWLETLNELNNFVRRSYPKGLKWKGDLDAPELIYKCDGTYLQGNPNKGETIQKILKEMNVDTAETENSKKMAPPGIFLKEGKKWRIEHRKSEYKHLTIDNADIDNVVYIYDCSNITIIVEQKINVIQVDSSTNISVIFRSLISGLEIIRCANVKLHAFGNLPSVTIDNSNDINIHLTKKGMDVEVITAQCSKISLSYPMDDGYYKTFEIPQRILTKISRDFELKSDLITDS